jgi:hypothetical protein
MFGTDLVSWHRADLGITIDGSNRVSDWADQSGGGHHLQQTTAGNRPDYVTTGAANSGPYVHSASYANAFMQYTGTPVGSTNGWSIFSIGALTIITGAEQLFHRASSFPVGGTLMQWRKESADGQQILMNTVVPAPNSLRILGEPDYAPVNTWNGAIGTMQSIADGGVRTVRAYANGLSSSSTDTKTSVTDVNLGQGEIFRFSATQYNGVALQEIGMIKRAITAAEVTALVAYFKARGVNTP